MELDAVILQFLARPGSRPLRPKDLANELRIKRSQLSEFKTALAQLVETGQLRKAGNGTVRSAASSHLITGTIRRSANGNGMFVAADPLQLPPDGVARVFSEDMADAFSGDQVTFKLGQRRDRGGMRTGRIVEVLSRATNQFVGSYLERNGVGFVQLSGPMAELFVSVGDPGAKGATIGDQVVVELLHFPTADVAGEGVITEVLGKRGEPGVDLQTIIAEFGLPDEFPDDVLEEARIQAQNWNDGDLGDRLDLTGELIITIDPVDARDFDDAISLEQLDEGCWRLGVHIADVASLVTRGGALDREAKRRGTSVYLPDKVLPMLPELLSNGLASLQQGRVRFTKSVFLELEADGTTRHVEFANSAINVVQRFAYEQVMPIINDPEGAIGGGERTDVVALLQRMQKLARMLRERRFRRGALNLSLPEVKLDMDRERHVLGAHQTLHDESHQIIEEFMLMANVAVANEFSRLGLPYLRRAHPTPDEVKLRALAAFAKGLGYGIPAMPGRPQLQSLLEQAAGQPTEMAINYALLRSLKQADYRPDEEGHFALAEANYCHFTSPIRRYPDLTIHRQLDEVIRSPRNPRAESGAELKTLGQWCSHAERRAADAERELIKLKLLGYLADKIGLELEAIVTGVERFGIFCLGKQLPAEGLIHVSQLPNDQWDYEEASHTLVARQSGYSLRLGDELTVKVASVDLQKRLLRYSLVGTPKRRVVDGSRPIASPNRGGGDRGKRPYRGR